MRPTTYESRWTSLTGARRTVTSGGPMEGRLEGADAAAVQRLRHADTALRLAYRANPQDDAWRIMAEGGSVDADGLRSVTGRLERLNAVHDEWDAAANAVMVSERVPPLVRQRRPAVLTGGPNAVVLPMAMLDRCRVGLGVHRS